MIFGRVISLVIGSRILNEEIWLCFQISQRVISNGKSGSETEFCPYNTVSPINAIPPMLHIHSFPIMAGTVGSLAAAEVSH
jgi:hypothetical protein